MNKVENWIQKDRYGVVRGTLLLGVVMLLCTCMVIRLFYSYDIISEEERASEAALRVTGQFEQLIDNSLTQMAGAADLISESGLDASSVLQKMVQYGAFSNAAILKDGELTHADGSASPAEGCADVIGYGTDAVEGEIIPCEDGRIQLRVSIGSGEKLAAWLNEDSVNAILCNAFIEDYGYAVYNAVTGAYIINHTVLDEEGYFEALRDLNGSGDTELLLYSGEAQARIERGGAAGDYYIAQQLTRIRPLGITLMIPEALVQSEAWIGRIMPHATFLAAVLMLAILISYTAFALRKVHLSRKDAVRALDIGERMMNIISREARITLFMYQRKQEALSYCYDGLSVFGGAILRVQATLSDIEEACGMDESESERLRDSLRELKPGDSTELLVHSETNSHEERILRFTLFASSEAEQGVICCISDCTQEQASLDRAELERSYQASVQGKTSSIWQINISRNRWVALHANKKDALNGLCVADTRWRDYNADLGSLLRDYLHPADYPAFAEMMSIVSIASMFRSGKTEFAHDYRVCKKAGGTDYEWHRMCVRIWLNPNTNDIFANLYVFNVNEAKNAELERGERKKVLHQTLVALGGLYYGLYYVDLENNLSYAARSLDGDLVTQLCSPYKSTFDEYIDSAVHPDDRESLRKLLSAYQLRKRMTEGSHFLRKEYRRKSGESYEQAAIIVQPARFENGVVKEVVLAIRYIGRDKIMEM